LSRQHARAGRARGGSHGAVGGAARWRRPALRPRRGPRGAPAGGRDGGLAGVLGRPHARHPRPPAARDLPRGRCPRRRRARPQAAVAGGNVETSQRIVDVLLRALARAAPDRVPAASAGSMNNLALGGAGFAYYETLAGGAGAGPHGPGLSAVHTHMTNTMNTPIEALEAYYPLRVRRYAVRRGSGGRGR